MVLLRSTGEGLFARATNTLGLFQRLKVGAVGRDAALSTCAGHEVPREKRQGRQGLPGRAQSWGSGEQEQRLWYWPTAVFLGASPPGPSPGARAKQEQG